MTDGLGRFQEPVRRWFGESFGTPTEVQRRGWEPILDGKSTLLLAPTGSGKTLAAFLAALDRLALSPEPDPLARLRVIYVSPIKALAADIEKNLRAPIAGIAAVAARMGVPFRVPTVGIRTGDTPQRERVAFGKHPPDILITTPESLYLLLTSNARERLTGVETLIVDEIHSLAGNKRGAHLFLSLERLEALRRGDGPLQRIGLSATQRPLEVVATLLGGGQLHEGQWRPRPVEIVDAGSKKLLELSVETPPEPAEGALVEVNAGVWPAVHPRLVELILAHRSTILFVNSRRLAERLALAINETAEQELALAHHGSLSHAQRQGVEERLKQGELRAIVATSSLELGIDMGAVDFVIQIESPPSVASGMQRLGRAGHSVDQTSSGVILAKHRGDLMACATSAREMMAARVEATVYPKNPLCVLSQQLVALVAMDDWRVEDAYDLVRRAASFAELSRRSFDNVLDMLSGHHLSDEFAGLRPRITWDREKNILRARDGARRVAVTNGGTIPDRGLYGVFLTDGERSVRVGELDEEMVFESRPGEVFMLGASSWRIDEITHDRVLVSPAPGQPGKMPFWHGDRAGRSAEFGKAVGALARCLSDMEPRAATELLTTHHGMTPPAAAALLGYLGQQLEASGVVPTDTRLLIERFVDEVGDFRVCVHTPFGARVHAPWSIAVVERHRQVTGGEVDAVYSDDGMVFRFPEADEAPTSETFLFDPEDIEALVVQGLGASALFAARFRENAARALLLPRRYPGRRMPLWAQRKRAQDLLAAAASHGSFPMLLETHRECLKDTFDLPALVEVFEGIRSRTVRVSTVDTERPSPFARSLLFGYVANFMYDGDAPVAERRAQALALDHGHLRELLGEAELREMLDPEVIDAVERELSRLTGRRVQSPDALHDLLIDLGPLALDEIALRLDDDRNLEGWIRTLRIEHRVFEVTIADERRVAAVEDAARLRDALGVVPALGIPAALLEPAQQPLVDLVSRYARTHGPFTAQDVANHFGIGSSPVLAALDALVRAGRVVEGEFLPLGRGREWCGTDVLRRIKQRSLARLRRAVEPVSPQVYARFLAEWQGVLQPGHGQQALLDAVEQLAGAPLVASELEHRVLPARVLGFSAALLDEACASGEVIWRGLHATGSRDGRIALYPADRYLSLAPLPTLAEGALAAKVRDLLKRRGASFFHDIVAELAGFPAELLGALWDLVWAGEVSNDTLAPLRQLTRASGERAAPLRPGRFAKRPRLPGSEGRWFLLPVAEDGAITSRRMALASSIVARYGVAPREAAHAEGVDGGFAAIYPVLKAMEEAGQLRRGYFVAGLGATQFALPGAEDRLRSLRSPSQARTWTLAATDPANPFGAVLPWPTASGRPARSPGARVVIHDGHAVGWLGKRIESVISFASQEGIDADAVREVLCRVLVDLSERKRFEIREIDAAVAEHTDLGQALLRAGFTRSAKSLIRHPSRSPLATTG